MLARFIFMLRDGGLKPSITELLTLLEAMKAGVAGTSVEDFYFLSRSCLVKDETLFDRFDKVFAAHFHGVEDAFKALVTDVPDDWLRKQAELMLSEEERAKIEALGGFEKLMEALRERLEEQQSRHQGGNKWIGTAGTSPFGAFGFNPEGVRIGQQGSRHRRATKVWDRREYRNLDDQVELGTRNIKLALRKLRKFAREGAADQLDLDDTIDKTARNAGLLDIRMVPERHNAIKVLLCLDIGGSMDDHVRVCEEMFSAARSEFKHLEYFYFHNFVYESMWKDNRRRHAEKIPTTQITHKYGPDYKLVFVGDATMSPYEIVYPGGSVEHWNEEAGSVWIKRLLKAYPKAIWLNPEPRQRWDYTPSIKLARELMDDRMYPLTISGIDEGIRKLH
ncbi:MAG: VWA domain-containing protein [Gammaproteobacteria bacterium]|nr:VWA domain-containing protein [Gammaproteobacteria bacterium]MDH4315665.1 VWA domain-containing protein [Gammaproteobacteria bacterium]MDH5213593.1 VWA domain-containing protein [Gammaproteobacteria bacterium]MDH5500464.1 VWA domain-containing protein [Gammaproteobacteria bacterium]